MHLSSMYFLQLLFLAWGSGLPFNTDLPSAGRLPATPDHDQSPLAVPNMIDAIWTAAEKKVAHRVCDAAVQRELSQLISEFKSKAAATNNTEALWEIRYWLDKRQREIDAEFDYRYSQLIFVFALLVRSGKLKLEDLAGLSEQKLAAIKFIAES